jgi:hypothetical protein
LILVGTALAAVVLIAAGVLMVRGAAEPKPNTVAELTSNEATVTTRATEPTVVPAAEVAPMNEPITTPQKGTDERKALMDAIRRHADNEDLVFIVDALVVQGDYALADVHPTPETDNGSFGRMWVALMRDGNGWRVEESIEPSEPDVDGALERWTWASRDLVERFFGASLANESATSAGSDSSRPDGLPTVESLTWTDLTPGFEFVIDDAEFTGGVAVDDNGGVRPVSYLDATRTLKDGTYAMFSTPKGWLEGDLQKADVVVRAVSRGSKERPMAGDPTTVMVEIVSAR